MLRLLNTLTGNLERFEPLENGQVKLYVCGPTVYDDAHLGHARCYITWDVLFRHLSSLGYRVHYVRNITDVDDKIINRAKAERVMPEVIATRYFERFSEDMVSLNVLSPTHQPKVTDYIPSIIEAIAALIEKQAAYVTLDGTVYFQTTACSRYGMLSKKPLDDLKAGARVDIDPQKRSPLDFALWKHTLPDEAYVWDSPWGKGRPGWHIECSVMNVIELGPQIDIHAGGADLIFPHHENEIAQSECWTGKFPFSKYWLHNGFVNVSGEKMSKSLGNFSTVRTLLETYDANVIRYFLLQHHYRMPVDFNDEALSGAKNRIRKIYRLLKPAVLEHGISVQTQVVLPQAYLESMADDLNTSKALAVFNQAMTQIETNQENVSNQPSQSGLGVMEALAIWDALGFRRDLVIQEEALPSSELFALASRYLIALNESTPAEEILLAIIKKRQEAKAAKDWAIADGIRKELLALGVQLMDSKDGKTTYEYDVVS